MFPKKTGSDLFLFWCNFMQKLNATHILHNACELKLYLFTILQVLNNAGTGGLSVIFFF